MGARRVYLHVGLQKTGTSYLQAVLFAAQGHLRERGLDLVPGSKREMFQVMLCVRERFDPLYDPPEAAMALARFPAQLGAAPGPVALLSEEALAASSPAGIRRLVAACADREVHLVFTVRDLARVVPSMWQQQLRSAGTVSFDDYLRAVVAREGPTAQRFLRNQDLPRVLDRWEEEVPASRIHVVTVPPPGSPATVLLERYCSMLAVDPAPLAGYVPPGNPSLGRVEAELLRRVNAGLPAERRRRQLYGDVGKRYFSQRVLGERRSEPARLPLELAPWCREWADEMVQRLAVGGYDVVGDLDDLRPRSESFARTTEPVDDTAVAEVAVRALVTMLDERIGRVQRRLSRRGTGARLRHGPRGGGPVAGARGVVGRLVRRFR